MIQEKEVQRIVDEWRNRAAVMEEYIDDPDDFERWVISFFRGRANELECKLLESGRSKFDHITFNENIEGSRQMMSGDTSRFIESSSGDDEDTSD